jgi:hypothetical protein
MVSALSGKPLNPEPYKPQTLGPWSAAACACLMELMRQERTRGDGTGLRHVSMRGNPIGDTGMDALALGIKVGWCRLTLSNPR